jgi:pyridoxal phosphate enzyme (YggS family)
MTEGRAARIAANIAKVQERIAKAAESAGRRADEVLLVAVTKGREAQDVVCAFRAGLRCFGENRPEEGFAKRQALAALLSPEEQEQLSWHMIGHVQSRKAKLVVGQYELVHSLDSLRLAEKLHRLAEQSGQRLAALLEVNTSGEQTKFGYPPPEPDGRPHKLFLEEVDRILRLERLEVLGLMTVAPVVPEPELARPYFRALRLMIEWLREHYPEVAWKHLSMGMTDDFEAAIVEGATIVRIGRAIFADES